MDVHADPDYLRLILTSKVYEIIEETPLVKARNLSTRLGNDIWLKREDLHDVFSFKIRGAYNFMANLSDEDRWKGVVTCSAGTHTCISDPPTASSIVYQETTPKELRSRAPVSESPVPSSCP